MDQNRPNPNQIGSGRGFELADYAHTASGATIGGLIGQILGVPLIFVAIAAVRNLLNRQQPKSGASVVRGALTFAALLAMRVVEGISQALFRIIGYIMHFAPLGAFGAIAFTVGQFGAGSLRSLGELLLEFFLVCALFTFVVLGAVCWWCGVSLFRLLGHIRDEIVIVAATTSTETVLPRLIEKMKKLGCEESVVGFVIPAGYSFNMDGSSIYLTMAALFIAQATNAHLSNWQELTVILICLITSKGAAGVVGSAFIALAATLASLGTIPVEGMVLILGVDRLMAEARSITNLIGNGVATILISKWEGEFNSLTAHEMLYAKDVPSAAEPVLVRHPDELTTRVAEQLEDLKK